MQRIWLAIRAFFAILFHGKLSAELLAALGIKSPARAPVAPPPAAAKASDGALQMLSILQRDSRLVDFLMEDISAYSDDQVGAAVRNLHDQCRQSLSRYLQLRPVIDGIEGTFTKVDQPDPATVKFIGNVPAQGRPSGGVLRHKGWQAQKIDLPPLASSQNVSVIAPAEIEIE